MCAVEMLHTSRTLSSGKEHPPTRVKHVRWFSSVVSEGHIDEAIYIEHNDLPSDTFSDILQDNITDLTSARFKRNVTLLRGELPA